MRKCIEQEEQRYLEYRLRLILIKTVHNILYNPKGETQCQAKR